MNTATTRELVRASTAVAGEVLESVGQHRLLSARQVHRMHTPTASMRWTRQVLTGLGRRGLISLVRAGRSGAALHFLTPSGHDELQQLGTRAETRRKQLTPEQAAGPLRAHTHAVNEVGIAFMLAARTRGDECGPLAWTHEIAHSIGPHRGQLLIADALLTYLQYRPDGELAFHYRLLELDRATLPTETLAAKLARYTHLYQYATPGQHTPEWRQRYPVFPGVICVLAGRSRQRLLRRADTVLALCAEDPTLTRTRHVHISLCLLEDLITRGPFAAVWQRPDALGQPTSWLGAAQTADTEPTP